MEETSIVVSLVVFLFTLFIVSLIPAIVTAVIASKKGFSAVGWFFIGLFLNWIGIVIVAVMKGNEPQNPPYPPPYGQNPYGTPYGAPYGAPYQPPTPQYKPGYNPYEEKEKKTETAQPYNGTCPYCGGYVSNSLCTNCQRVVNQAPVEQKPVKKYCKSCGEEVSSPFCPNCGAKQDQ